MRAAAGAVHDASFRRQPRCQHDAAGGYCGASEDLGIDSIALRADAKAGANIVGDSLIRFRLAQSRDVGGCMESVEFLVGCYWRVMINRVREPAERST